MLNTLLVIFWALTYISIVFCSIKFRQERAFFMPLIAGALNFSWEIHALITSGGYWGHIVWLALDCIILAYNIYCLSQPKKQLLYSSFVIICTGILYGIFSITTMDGMLISSFVIDIIMAVEYVLVIKHISSRGRLLIGVLRLLGDMFAWLCNMHHSSAVLFIGILVLITNLFYCSYCLELKSEKYFSKQRRK